MTIDARKVQQHKSKRSIILDAAMEITSREGLSGLTYRKISALAGVSLGTITYYFGSLDQIIQEGLSAACQQSGEEFMQRMGRAESPAETLSIVVDIIVDYQSKKTESIIILEALKFFAGNETLQKFHQPWPAILHNYLLVHFDQGRAAALDAFVKGTIVQSALGRISVTKSEAMRILNSIAPPLPFD